VPGDRGYIVAVKNPALVLPFRVRNLGIYLFGIVILWLQGVYFGGYLKTLFIFALGLPLVSIVLALYSATRLRYGQRFDNEHPAKGQTVHYRLALSNEGIFPVSHLHVHFKRIQENMDLVMAGFSCFLRPREQVVREFSFHCAYRGIYTVGLERLEVEDALRVLAVRRPVVYQTFYVYPRILELAHFALSTEYIEGTGTGIAQGGDPDYALFTQLKEYRTGESIRHMHWKKYISTGVPFIKEYDTTAEPDLRLYLDLRRPAKTGLTALDIEDTSVEILVALVKNLLERRIGIQISAPGREVYRFGGSHPSQFERFYRSTMNLIFQDTISPATLYRADTAAASYEGTAVIITHLLDGEVFSLLEESLSGNQSLILIFNQAGLERQERDQAEKYFHNLRERGARILQVNSSDTIIADLESGS
jgi:uncharacterized protein (DUF58 family)